MVYRQRVRQAVSGDRRRLRSVRRVAGGRRRQLHRLDVVVRRRAGRDLSAAADRTCPRRSASSTAEVSDATRRLRRFGDAVVGGCVAAAAGSGGLQGRAPALRRRPTAAARCRERAAAGGTLPAPSATVRSAHSLDTAPCAVRRRARRPVVVQGGGAMNAVGAGAARRHASASTSRSPRHANPLPRRDAGPGARCPQPLIVEGDARRERRGRRRRRPARRRRAARPTCSDRRRCAIRPATAARKTSYQPNFFADQAPALNMKSQPTPSFSSAPAGRLVHLRRVRRPVVSITATYAKTSSFDLDIAVYPRRRRAVRRSAAPAARRPRPPRGTSGSNATRADHLLRAVGRRRTTCASRRRRRDRAPEATR